MNTTSITKSTPRKPLPKRLFSGVAGSPLACVDEPAAVAGMSKSAQVLDSDPQPAAPQSRDEIRREKARLRAKKIRDQKRKQDPEAFRAEEAKRKQAQRDKANRKEELKELLDSGQYPTRMSLLETKNGPPLTAVNEEGKTVRVATGGYDADKLNEVIAEQQRAEGGKSVFTPPAKPNGEKKYDPESGESNPDTGGRTFIRDIHFLPTKEVKAMRKFIDSHFTESRMMVCSVCRQQVAPKFDYEAGFVHLQDRHAQLFVDMTRLARTAKKCPEDHEGMVTRHGAGMTRKLYCKRCRKLLYDPANMRTDKSPEREEPVNPIPVNRIQSTTAPVVL